MYKIIESSEYMKKYIIGFAIGAIIFGSIGVMAANYLYHADEVSFTPDDSNWDVSHVESAIDDLYDKVINSSTKKYYTETLVPNFSSKQKDEWIGYNHVACENWLLMYDYLGNGSATSSPYWTIDSNTGTITVHGGNGVAYYPQYVTQPVTFIFWAD